MLFVIVERRPHFISAIRERRHNFIEKTLDKVGEFLIDVQNYTGGWLKFNFMVQALPGGLVVYIKLFYWCGLIL